MEIPIACFFQDLYKRQEKGKAWTKTIHVIFCPFWIKY